MISFASKCAGSIPVLLAMAFSMSAAAIDLDLIDTSVADPEQTLIDALVQPGSGITIVPGSVQFIGRIGDDNLAQSALYSNFNLAPNSGGGPTVTIGDGVLLTSGVADIPLTNTINQWDHKPAGVSPPGTGGNAQLSTLVGVATHDQNVIRFDFTLDNPADNGIAVDLVFGSDEYPAQTETDVFGFFVDGVNFAEFPGGTLIGNNNDSQFISNPVGSNLYEIEYNGITPRFTIGALVDSSLTTHTAVFAIADTSDSSFDSGAFLSNVRAGYIEDGGIGDPGEPIPAIPVPVNSPIGLLVLLLAMMLAGVVALRQRIF